MNNKANSMKLYKSTGNIIRHFFFLTFTVLFIISCKKDNDSTNIIKNIQPLEVGDYWTFVDSTFSDVGVLSNVDTSTVSVVGKEIVFFRGKEIELFYWKWDNYNAIWLYTSEDGSKYCYGLRLNEISYVTEKSLVLKYPITTGDTWTEYRFGFDQENLNCFVSDSIENECLYTNKPYHTTVGKLDCIVTKYSDQIGTNLSEVTVYHCPELGYVGLESRLNGVMVFSKRLIDYNLVTSNAFKTTELKQCKGNYKNLSTSYGIVSK